MNSVLKYLTAFIILVLFGLSYLLFTSSGNTHTYNYLGKIFSKKTDLDIKVRSVNIENFPFVTAVMNVDKKAKLVVNGEIGLTTLDINYTFSSDTICYEDCSISDDLHIDGNVTGRYDKMYVTGQGTALEGEITYETIKRTDSIEDLRVVVKDINSTKLFQLMDYEALIHGKANITINVDYMNEKHKRANFTYDVYDNNFSGIPLSLYTKVNIKDMKHDFMIDLTAPSLSLKITEGEYDQEQKLGNALYTLDIKDLSDIETLLDSKYLGELNTTGKITYDKYLKITGTSKNYGGTLDYLFERDGLTIDLDDVSLKSFTSIFPYEPVLDASTTGNIYYNFIRKTMIVNSKLKNTRFLRSKFAKNFYKKSRLKMYKETFKDATLDAGYYNGTFTADIKLGRDNRRAHITRAIINTRKNTIHSYFDFKLQKKLYTGKIYGAYSNPKIHINIKEAIEYMIGKQIDTIIGEENRQNASKMIKTMPLGKEVKDKMSETAASVIKRLIK